MKCSSPFEETTIQFGGARLNRRERIATKGDTKQPIVGQVAARVVLKSTALPHFIACATCASEVVSRNECEKKRVAEAGLERLAIEGRRTVDREKGRSSW